jgi:hypothetical protein
VLIICYHFDCKVGIEEVNVNKPCESYVLHCIPSQSRERFTEFRPAFKAFKKAMHTNGGLWGARGSVALWHNNGKEWTRVYETDYYPVGLMEPYEH